jgi:hypothetical protein
MNRQWMRRTIGIGLVGIIGLSAGCVSLPLSSAQLTTAAIDFAEPIASPTCPRTDWELLEGFETPQYFLALCQQEELLYLVGYAKGGAALTVLAPAQQENDRIFAEDANKYSYEIRHNTLTIKHNGSIIVQEGIS